MDWGLKQCVWWAAAVLLASPARRVDAQTAPARIAKYKLEDYGWQPLPRRGPHEWAGTTGQLLTIDHKGRILVGYTVREREGLAARQNPTLSFHIIRITREGKADVSLSLPTDNWRSVGVYLDAQDHILARANGSLQMLRGENQSPQRLNWKVLAPCTMNCWISQSPSRRTLIISESVDGSGHSTEWHTEHSTYTLLDASSSEARVLQTCSKMAFSAQTITDKFAYWLGSFGTEYFTRRYAFCDLDHPEVLPLDDSVSVPLNDELFVIDMSADHKWVVGVVSAIGGTKFELKLPKNERSGRVSGDERGDRFAYAIGTYRGGFSALDIPPKPVASRIVVFESESGRQLASVPVQVHVSIGDGAFQLSPDGHTLASLQDGVLTVADIE